MMQQNNIVREQPALDIDLVISIYNESACVDAGLLSCIDRIGIIYRYNLICSVDTLLQRFPNAVHYLDHFWILLPTSIKEQRVLWREFYRLYSPIYNQLINRSHNLLCLHYFKQLLEDKLIPTSNQRLLDFGCGLGLSAGVFDPATIVCYDNNEVMRNSSRERGLVTLNERQFRTLTPNTFDGCFACYVLHLAISIDDLNQLARVLRGGGVIVANYYKGINADRVNRIFREKSLTVEQIENQQGRFGSIYVYRKL